MTASALLFTLAAIGISETAYLIRKRIASERPICPIGDSCGEVLSSRFSRMFVIPSDILGFLFYMVTAFIAGILVVGAGSAVVWKMLLIFAVSGASIVSAVFTYVQWKILKAWCFWCVMSACTVWLMGLILIASKLHLP